MKKITIVLILLIGLSACSPDSVTSPSQNQPPKPALPAAPSLTPPPAQHENLESEPVSTHTEPPPREVIFEQFTRLPFDIENVSAVTPVGGFSGGQSRSNPYLGRPYGNERHFMWHKTPGEPYNVYAPATTYIISVRKSKGIGQYGLNFEIFGDGHFRLDHIHVLSPELEQEIDAQLGGWEETSPFVHLPKPILVQAGDILGQTGVYEDSINWDWFVEDRIRHEGITFPEHYWSTIFAYSRSVYELCTEEVKRQLETLAGYPSQPQIGLPILGQFGSDVEGTLSGTWFNDYTNDPQWGPRIAVFRPYHMDPAKIEIKLAIPELDLYGVWIITPGQSGINQEPWTITPDSGIVYYLLEENDVSRYGEYGLLLAQLTSDGTIRLETHRDSFNPGEFPVFSGDELTLSR